MRGIKGLDRPEWQWGLVAVCLLLIASVVAAALTIRRASAQMADVEIVYQRARTQLEQMEADLARERAAREAFSHEVARLRADGQANVAAPVVTLEPSKTRDATPPDPAAQAVAPEQVVLLRFVLPPKAVENSHGYQVTARDWSSGEVRWVRAALSPVKNDGSIALAVSVIGEMLPDGAYEFLVSDAGREVASYELTVGPAVR
jgi:hypothetical protein